MNGREAWVRISWSGRGSSERKVVEVGVVGRGARRTDVAATAGSPTAAPAAPAVGEGAGGLALAGRPAERALVLAVAALEVDDGIGGDLQGGALLAVAAFEFTG